MKKVLVTGAAGFIGSSFIKKLLEEDNFEVLGLDNINDYYSRELKLYRLEDLRSRNFSFEKIDINDPNLLEKTFIDFEPEMVINLAAQAGVRYSSKNPTVYVDSNINGFFNLLNLSRKYKIERFIYASSSSVYGSSEIIPFNENKSPTKPISLYGSTKLSNEKMAISFSENFNLRTLGLRFFTVYGPKGRPDMAYFSFTKDILNENQITIFNNGKMSRDMTFIDDICEGIFNCLSFNFKKRPFEILNLGNDYPIELMKLIKFIEDRVKKKANIIYKDSPEEVKQTHADLNKSLEMIDYSPQTSFEDGMDKFLKWYFEYFNEK
tara:strand:- start:2328 stop:3293 length:966 start_codon:yes stop_codon:yes gene_type:complete